MMDGDTCADADIAPEDNEENDCNENDDGAEKFQGKSRLAGSNMLLHCRAARELRDRVHSAAKAWLGKVCFEIEI